MSAGCKASNSFGVADGCVAGVRCVANGLKRGVIDEAPGDSVMMASCVMVIRVPFGVMVTVDVGTRGDALGVRSQSALASSECTKQLASSFEIIG